MWRQGAWGEVDLLHQGNATFANLAWITERLPSLDGLSKWTKLTETSVSPTAHNTIDEQTLTLSRRKRMLANGVRHVNPRSTGSSGPVRRTKTVVKPRAPSLLLKTSRKLDGMNT
jgi:hypothetical protein